jgi:epoxyqueuosine reductase
VDASWNAELLEWVTGRALAAGFSSAGVAGAPAASDADGELTAERFATWVDQGRAGQMEYLKRSNDRGELLRSSARSAIPWARSVIVCALNYNGDGPRSTEPTAADRGWIARYAWLGQQDGSATDYHDDLLRRLRSVESELLAKVPQPCKTLCYVDTGPLLERDFAARAGVGWVGKNTCVIDQQQGSWLLLAVIVTSLELPAEVALPLHPDRCGSCTRCIDACPTDALVAPREMDASRCISYLTIELKGSVPVELREGIGRQVFGCDICQDVCPWNRRAPTMTARGLSTRAELVNPALEWLAELDDAGFRREFKGSPLERTKRGRVLRNVAIAMGNSGEKHFISQLEQWAKGDDPLVADAADWALRRLHGAD